MQANAQHEETDLNSEFGIQMEPFMTPVGTISDHMTGPPQPQSTSVETDWRRQDGSSSATPNVADEEPGEQLEPGERAEEEKLSHDKHFILLADEPGTVSLRILRHLAIIGLLSITSMFGFLAREGLVAMSTFDGMSVDSTIWAQSVGCLVIGYTVANRAALERW
jgi:hypothetical protein